MDAEGLEFWHESDWVKPFDTALAVLDRYPWHMLHPRQVHPDFRGQVWAAVEERWRRHRDGFGRSNPWWWHQLGHDRWHRRATWRQTRRGEVTRT
jgi:hypothetical protein